MLLGMLWAVFKVFCGLRLGVLSGYVLGFCREELEVFLWGGYRDFCGRSIGIFVGGV